MAEPKILRVGIIGCGKIFESHSQAYPDHPNAVVTAFYDRIRSRAEKWKAQLSEDMCLIKEAAKERHEEEDINHLKRCEIFENECKVYDNVQELLEHVDLIDISAPNYAHAPYAIWALKKNISVMSEKPPALCSLETKDICTAVKNSKGFYQVNENFFWQLYIREFRKLILSKEIGEIKQINIRLGHGGPSWGWQNHFLNPSLSGGGVLSDMGIHAIGLLLGILDPAFKLKQIQSIKMNSGTQKERTLRDSDGANEYYLHKFMVEDDVEIKVWFNNEAKVNSKNESKEVEATIVTSWSKTYQEVEIMGSLGKAYLDLDEMKRFIIKIAKNGQPTKTHPIPPQARDSHQLEIVDFVNRILKGEKSIADEKIAHTIQTIVSGAYLSNLRSFESSRKSSMGIPITPQDLENFYAEILEGDCPQNFLLEEIVYRFMSPFTSTYYTPEE
ncbi:hypothetical protein NEF87_003807 [Candidatus Lokiarchaeum ossiferum]|uniref:Gfo/Idh/MocA family oxidoreductase n=1 Tax=Candidatus Lokiarchaeum ossiferum TaxID=2951803 RepID=A0ABY6HVH4_9ARCH|nr:hypothetical protein NEF87_003807 [Candidatus Lokiarchaeum sp. B-35]